MSPFYLLYGVNPRIPGDDALPTPEQYDERSDPAPFLSRERAKALQATIKRAMENKKRWDKGVKPREKFNPGDWVLIRTRKPKKFEAPWWGPYQIVRAEILNTYVVKPPGGTNNKYLISGDRMKRARVDGRLTRGWRMPKGSRRPGKVQADDTYSARESNHAVAVRSVEEFLPMPESDEEDGDQPVLGEL